MMNRYLILLLCSAAQAAPQAYVASAGSDTNTAAGCSRTAICRTFQAAMSVVDAGGEIVALDSAEYGPLKITKPVAVIGAEHALIAPTTTDAVMVNTTGDVTLRGLTLRGIGSNDGIFMGKIGSLLIEKCAVSNFTTGLHVVVAARVQIIDSLFAANSNGASIDGGATADVVRSAFEGNTGAGLTVGAEAAATNVSVSDSVASGNLYGFMAASTGPALAKMSIVRSTASNNRNMGFAVSVNAVLTVGDSMASGNGTGFAMIPGVPGSGAPGVFETMGNNVVRQNGAATSGPMTAVPGT